MIKQEEGKVTGLWRAVNWEVGDMARPRGCLWVQRSGWTLENLRRRITQRFPEELKKNFIGYLQQPQQWGGSQRHQKGLGIQTKDTNPQPEKKTHPVTFPSPPPHLLGRMNPISNKMLKVRAISTSFNRFFWSWVQENMEMGFPEPHYE